MRNIFENEYKQLLMRVLLKGELADNRTKEKTFTLFNQNFNIDLKYGFPIVTGKKVFFAKNGKLGKIYGYQIRKFNGEFDQVKYAINEIKQNSRRAIISLWNPTDLKEQALPCCYTQLTFVRIKDKLNMLINFRSSDLFLGLPYDVIFASLFLYTIAKECNLQPSNIGINIANAHIYENHKKQVLQYYRKPIYVLPTLKGNYDNYKIENYKSGELIKAKLVL